MNNIVIQAAYFAAEKHKTQRRKDVEETPYINHPLALANVLAVECSIDDVEVMCGALLHDTIEDTETSEAELVEAFGENITRIVLEVTDDKELLKIERKEAQVAYAPHMDSIVGSQVSLSSQQMSGLLISDFLCYLIERVFNILATNRMHNSGGGCHSCHTYHSF